MDTSSADDGTDFRPFFDMVIGIMFVLLILVAAQIYFQQTQVDTVASEDAKREAVLRRVEVASFLKTLTDRLRADGLDATADAEAGAVLLPLNEVLAIDHAGLPSVQTETTARLGAALAGLTACVTLPRSHAPTCAGFTRLALDALSITTRIGPLPSSASLPRDRFGELTSALLSATILSSNPELVSQSNLASGRVTTFTSALTANNSTREEISGELTLDFTFQ